MKVVNAACLFIARSSRVHYPHDNIGWWELRVSRDTHHLICGLLHRLRPSSIPVAHMRGMWSFDHHRQPFLSSPPNPSPRHPYWPPGDELSTNNRHNKPSSIAASPNLTFNYSNLLLKRVYHIIDFRALIRLFIKGIMRLTAGRCCDRLRSFTQQLRKFARTANLILNDRNFCREKARIIFHANCFSIW